MRCSSHGGQRVNEMCMLISIYITIHFISCNALPIVNKPKRNNIIHNQLVLSNKYNMIWNVMEQPLFCHCFANNLWTHTVFRTIKITAQNSSCINNFSNWPIFTVHESGTYQAEQSLPYWHLICVNLENKSWSPFGTYHFLYLCSYIIPFVKN